MDPGGAFQAAVVRSINPLHKDLLNDKYLLPTLSISLAADPCNFIILYPLFGRNIFAPASESAIRSGRIEASSRELEWIEIPSQAALV